MERGALSSFAMQLMSHAASTVATIMERPTLRPPAALGFTRSVFVYVHFIRRAHTIRKVPIGYLSGSSLRHPSPYPEDAL